MHAYCAAAGFDLNTIIGAVMGALGILIVILFLVCLMLIAMAATSRKKRDFQVQGRSRTVHGTALISMASSSCLSYYDDSSAVAVALKAISTEEVAPQKWTASGSISDDCTGGSYVAIANIIDAKHLWRSERLDEMLETYEDMNGPNSDTVQSDDHLYSLDETLEKYEDMYVATDMTLPKGIKLAQGGKTLCSLDEGWEEGDRDRFDDTHDDGDAVLAKKLNEQPDWQIAGQDGHGIDEILKKSAGVAVTDSNKEYYVECDGMYDDIKDVDELYEEIDEVAPSGQPDECPGRKIDGQSIKQSSIPPIKQLSKQSTKQPGELSDGQQDKQPEKCPEKQTARQSLGKSSPCYQPLCLPHSLGDIPEQYTKLQYYNQERQTVTWGRPTMRQPSHSSDANGEVRPPSHRYTSVKKPSRCPDADGLERPLSRRYSSMREPSHRESRPPSHQYSSVTELSPDTDENVVIPNKHCI